jgi:hypothetical protein
LKIHLVLLALELPAATSQSRSRWATYKKPTAQTAHLVFADTKANAKKTKRAVFCQRSDRN